MRILFLGTPDFAIPTLRALHESPHRIVGLITRPDRSRGRKGSGGPSPVQQFADQVGIPVLPPEPVNSASTYGRVRDLGPEIAVVVAFGSIVSVDFLALPSRGCVNLHASLLPRHRGAAPIQWSVARGDAETGVTTMQMDRGLDTGPVLLQRRVAIPPEWSAVELAARLSQEGADLVLETLDGLASGTVMPRPQSDQGVSLAPRLTREDGRIDWSWDAQRVVNLVRGMQPWPVAWTQRSGEWLRVLRASAVSRSGAAPPGTVLGGETDAIMVAASEGTVALHEVQPASRRRMSGREALNGRAVAAGDLLG